MGIMSNEEKNIESIKHNSPVGSVPFYQPILMLMIFFYLIVKIDDTDNETVNHFAPQRRKAGYNNIKILLQSEVHYNLITDYVSESW